MRCGLRPRSSSSPRSALALGHTLRQPSQMGANDISRWCTVWSLLERGTYVIDECPWQADTQDKVFRAPKGAIAAPGEDGAGPTLLLEQARVITDLDRRDSLSGAARDRRTARPSRAPGARLGGPKSRTPTPPTGSKGYWRRPKIPCVGPFTSSTSSRSWCCSISFPLEYCWCSTLGCSTATRPTSGPGFSVWSPRHSGRISCRLRKR